MYITRNFLALPQFDARTVAGLVSHLSVKKRRDIYIYIFFFFVNSPHLNQSDQ